MELPNPCVRTHAHTHMPPVSPHTRGHSRKHQIHKHKSRQHDSARASALERCVGASTPRGVPGLEMAGRKDVSLAANTSNSSGRSGHGARARWPAEGECAALTSRQGDTRVLGDCPSPAVSFTVSLGLLVVGKSSVCGRRKTNLSPSLVDGGLGDPAATA